MFPPLYESAMKQIIKMTLKIRFDHWESKNKNCILGRTPDLHVFGIFKTIFRHPSVFLIILK